MDDLLEDLTTDIDADTEISVTASDLESVIDSDSEPPHADQSHDEKLTQNHTDEPLTDDDVAMLNRWLGDDELRTISDEIVTEHINQILLLLIAVRDGACGKDLLQDVRQLFGTDLSPGTVYPHLSDLADDDILELQKLRKHKLYSLSNPAAVFNEIDQAVDQLLLFSLFLNTILTDCKTNQSQSQSHRSENDE
jgi:DNA-binding transcriptional ArsR family regulator